MIGLQPLIGTVFKSELGHRVPTGNQRCGPAAVYTKPVEEPQALQQNLEI